MHFSGSDPLNIPHESGFLSRFSLGFSYRSHTARYDNPHHTQVRYRKLLAATASRRVSTNSSSLVIGFGIFVRLGVHQKYMVDGEQASARAYVQPLAVSSFCSRCVHTDVQMTVGSVGSLTVCRSLFVCSRVLCRIPVFRFCYANRTMVPL
ncbi:uncharacterized protein CC84DRAFT_375090 [Paraphaeosphaeria sporulosa]|uniref:Uncharacterized protein n=1 Tax=Paraphaeosphaeria sporulosa TaxID=1460663 RepID=A0A177BZ73_9PLEO|nr:uncharacterized protein CC84DRAFT_375090 [Paraphaeosphaeria sporulosa]OAF99649.1 hypothetical protein CC84DRAFT_375090 [Paraphaeosphaeria sporulosa]